MWRYHGQSETHYLWRNWNQGPFLLSVTYCITCGLLELCTAAFTGAGVWCRNCVGPMDDRSPS